MRLYWLAAGVVRKLAFRAGECGGRVIDRLTRFDYARSEAQIRVDIIHAAERS